MNFWSLSSLLDQTPLISRRTLFHLMGGSGSMWLSAPAHGTPQLQKDPRPPLMPGQKIPLSQQAIKTIGQKASRLAAEYLAQYGGCAQCTLAALQDSLPFLPPEPAVFRTASCLDGGATPTGLHHCGAFTAAGLAIGYLCGRTRDEIFFGDRSLARQLLQKVFTQFQKHYGTVLCKQIREKLAPRNCQLAVSQAAQWTAEILLDTFAYSQPASAAPPCTE